MAFLMRNTNPRAARVGDCVIRAISLATDRTWSEVYSELCAYGYALCDMPSSNAVWGLYLKDEGYKRYIVPDECPEECYTIKDFCRDHPSGTYILGTGTHVVCTKNGDYLDTWDSGNEVPIYYWKR